MNNVVVYCEIDEGNVAEVSQELLSKGRSLANDLNCKLEAIAIGANLKDIGKQIFPYGVDHLHVADDKRLEHYQTLPHTKIICNLIKKEKPQVALFGASTIGRDLAPRVASNIRCGLTADCTDLQIGDHTENKTKKEYKNLLYQIRPAFGGNIIATIINPETRPQMATVREGVMKKTIVSETYKGETNTIDTKSLLNDEDLVLEIIERHIEKKDINIKNANIIISGGYGVGSKQNFQLLFDLADALGAEVGASRAAVDAGFVEHDRQVGQTGVTVRPKLYIACGISGQVQHRAGMTESSMIISINTDENAPINNVADYAIIGDLNEIIPKLIKAYKSNIK
jgi:electron transfer flavoprotein alpha subunit